MKLGNYLPKLAEKFPDLYIDGIKEILQEIKKTISVAECSRILEVKENTLRAILNGRSRCSLGFLKKISETLNINLWDEIFDKEIFLDGQNHKKNVKVPKVLTEGISYLLGALRDGSLIFPASIEFSQKNINFLKNIREILKIEFGVECKIYGPQKKDGCYYIKLQSLGLFAILWTLSNWKRGQFNTPEIILSAPKELQRPYIKAFFDAEGSFKSNGNPVIYQTWKDESGCPPLQDISKMLLNFGIKSKLYGPYRGVNRPSYELYIPSEYKNKFLALINNPLST
jgi:intein/homing endonuclease